LTHIFRRHDVPRDLLLPIPRLLDSGSAHVSIHGVSARRADVAGCLNL
jgi:hypothetical protein